MPQTQRAGRLYRSMLYVPGHKLEWMLKAEKYGADAYIYDLEDAVSVDGKKAARQAVATAIGALKDRPFGRFVRLNGWRTGEILQDLLAVVIEGLDGVILAKTEDPEDISALDLVLAELEQERGLQNGAIEIVPLAETAIALYKLYEICMASARVKRACSVGQVFNGGDGNRALGITVNESGDESLYFDAYSIIQARAAGITQITGGMSSKIDDLDLVRRMSQRAKGLGATGARAIHPSHIPVLNEVYAPTATNVQEARETLHAMAAAIARGDAAVKHKGRMVDYAHVRSALELIDKARAVGIDVGEIPSIDVFSYRPNDALR